MSRSHCYIRIERMNGRSAGATGGQMQYYRCGIGNYRKTYGTAGGGGAKTVHRRLPYVATILGRSTRGVSARGGQTGGNCAVARYAGQF